VPFNLGPICPLQDRVAGELAAVAGFGYVHAAEFGLPSIDAGIADAVLAAKLRDRRASFVLPQNPDDLFVCETSALHSLVLSMGQSLLQNGLFQRGKVRRHGEKNKKRIIDPQNGGPAEKRHHNYKGNTNHPGRNYSPAWST